MQGPAFTSQSGGRICAIAANPALDRVAVAPGAAAGGTVRAITFADTAGGKAVHAAAAAAALGADVEVVAALGGSRGALVSALLRERGIACYDVPIESETRGTYTLIDPLAGDVVEVIEPSPTLSAHEAASLEVAVASAVAGAGVVLASGSLPSGVDPAFYAMVVDQARRAGALSLIDAHGVALGHALAAGPDLVKPNLSEALSLIGQGADAELATEELLAAARHLRDLGARMVWLTLGDRGSLLLDESGSAWRLTLDPPRLVSAVGCGDALLGGLAAGLARGLALLDAARLGVAAAADKLGRAHPGLVESEGVIALLPRVVVESLSAADPRVLHANHKEEP